MKGDNWEPCGELYALLMHLRFGGAIVNLASLEPAEQVQARSLNRVYVDRDGFGYAWRPVAPRPTKR